MKFSVCVIEPEGYKFSHFLYDSCKYLCYSIEANGFDCCMVKNRCYSDRVNIILGAHNLTDPAIAEQIKRAGKYVIIQSEIIGEGGLVGWPHQPSYHTIYLPLLRGAVAVWESLESNIPLLQKLGIHAELIPKYGYLPQLEEVIHKKRKDIDFLYYGSMTENRKKLISELTARGANIVCLFDEAAIFRNDYIARTRIHLVPKQSQDVNLITTRLLYLLNNRSVVVAERFNGQEWIEQCLLSADAGQWADLCLETLRRPDLDQLADEFFKNYKKLDLAHLFLPLIDKLATMEDSSGNRADADTLFWPGFQAEATPGLTSIIILTNNRLDYTKKCVNSIINHTPEAHEIIFVDNGSTDGTVKWLRQLVKEHPDYRLIENAENLGIPKGYNQGIVASRGEYILLLNNDVVVTENWLSGMMEHLNRLPNPGIVGPMTNNVSGPQQVPEVDYRSTASELDGYAAAFRKHNRFRRITRRRLVGFCMLFKRSLVEKIGPLDERFSTGNFEDEDFGLRAVLSGGINYIAGDVFIHHSDTRERGGNRQHFASKWNSVRLNTPSGVNLFMIKVVEDAKEHLARGRTREALEALHYGIKLIPSARFLHLVFAETLFKLERFKEALEFLQQAQSEKVDNMGLLLTGYAQEELGCFDEAEAIADQVLASEPVSASAMNLKGKVAHKRGDGANASRWYQKAIATDSGYGEPYVNLGILEWSSGRQKEAFPLIERGFILSADDTRLATAYHSAVTALEAWERGEKVFREARAIYPSEQQLAYLLIDILLHNGNDATAMDMINQVMLEFGSDNLLKVALEVRNKIGPVNVIPKGKKGGISVCMIVKNEEKNLPRALMSLQPLAQEIIVVDTGSTDRTREVAAAFGAKVFEHPWDGDFSSARNYSLEQAVADWILVMDADEVIAQQDIGGLKKIVEKKSGPRKAWFMASRNYLVSNNAFGWIANDGGYPREEAGTGWICSYKVRLFPNDRRIRFENRVHELVEPSVQRLNVPTAVSAIPVHHYGGLDSAHTTAKGEVYYELGKKKLEEQGETMDALREIAMQAHLLQKFEESRYYWERLILMSPDYVNAYLGLSAAFQEMGCFREALEAAKNGMALAAGPCNRDLVASYAICELYNGNAVLAMTVLKDLVAREPNFPMASNILAVATFCAADDPSAFESLGPYIYKKNGEMDEAFLNLIRKLKAAGSENYAEALLKEAEKWRKPGKGNKD